ncbi:MAG: S1C family serine protease [Kiloniellaceae bacterium]
MRSTIYRAIAVVVGMSWVLSGCGGTAPLDIPALGPAPTLSSVSLNLSPDATFALTKIIADIKRGEVIGAFPSRGIETKGSFCNYTSGSNDVITWGGGSRYLGNWSTELGTVFYETMTGQGYSIAGDPSDLFLQEKAVLSAEYIIGGRIKTIKSNFCHQHHWWDGRPLYEYSGIFYIDVEWSILNTLTQDIVFKKAYPGRFVQQQPIKEGIPLMLQGAFADSVARLAADTDVKALADGQKVARRPIQSVEENYTVVNGERSLAFDTDRMRAAVVTVRIGQGHGSGFFIGKGGLVVTNAHVVGDANTVQVRLSSGVELTGRVMVRDQVQDVALVDTGARFSAPPYVDVTQPALATEVYAVGSPILESLDATGTKGIGSAMRTDPVSGRRVIQADVAISPGSSGGPLFNGEGHIIGISAAKYSTRGAEGLGLFIPIGDALSALGVGLKAAS